MNQQSNQPTPDDAEQSPAFRPDLDYSSDDLFEFNPEPCIPIFFPDDLIKPTGAIPVSRMASLPGDPRRYVRTSLREALAWCATLSGHPVSVTGVEDRMWRYGLIESDILIDPIVYRRSGFRVFDSEKRAGQITEVSSMLTGVAYDPADDEHPGELFVRLPPRFVCRGETRNYAEVLDWACQTWGLLGTERETECRALIAKARGVRYLVDQFRDGTFEVPRLSLPVWRGIASLLLPKPPLADLPF